MLIFAALLAGVHLLLIAFHLVMMSNSFIGSAVRSAYYSRSRAKETWPLFDYYLPTMLLTAITIRFFHRRSILLHIAAWVLCVATIVGAMPLYSTRLVPTPVTTWKNPTPPPFERLPENSPFLLLIGVASLLGRFAMRADQSSESSESPR